MVFIKPARVQYTELLYALNGYLDSRYYLDVNDHTTIQWTNFKATFTDGDGRLPQVDELLHLASLYIRMRDDYLDKFSNETDQLKFLIYSLISKVISKTYIKELISYDYPRRLNCQTVIGLNCLLRYRFLFVDTLNILNDLTEDNKTLALLKLTALYKDKYEIAVNVKNDPFFQGIWSWLVNGSVPYNIRTSFYINPQPSSKNYALNFDKFPNIIDTAFGVQIHHIGNLIRYIKANGLPTQNLQNHAQLFWEYFPQREALYGSSVQFKYFLEEVKAFVFENVLQVTQAKESFLEFLTLLKAFYLYEDESFWTNFVYACRKTSDDTNVRKHFTEALYNTYEEETASRYQSLVNVKLAAEEDKGKRDTLKRKKKNTNYYSPMEMLIKHSPLVRIFYAKETLISYKTIFNHLYRLHSTRTELIACWKEKKFCSESSLGEGDNLKAHYLYFCLLHTFTALFTFCKFVIKYKMASYEESISNIIEVDQIQKLHDDCLLNIIARLFIKHTFIINLQNELVQLSKELLQRSDSNSNVDELLKKYNQLTETFRQWFETNQKHVDLFGEVLDSI